MTTEEQRPSTSILIAILGAITAFDAMAIDLYLPGFQDIGHASAASPAAMQSTLAVFVGGAAIGQIFYGPLADRIGRRTPLALGIVLFVAASVLAALSRNIETLIVARGLQGLGAAAGLVIPRAIIADRYRGREIAKLFSALLQVMMIRASDRSPGRRSLGGRTGMEGRVLGTCTVRAPRRSERSMRSCPKR